MFLYLFSANELTVWGWTLACVALYSGVVFNVVLQLSCWSHRKLALKTKVLPPFLPGGFSHVSGALTTELFTLPYIIIITTIILIILIIIIKVFLKREILSLETILSARTHTRTHARTHAHTHTHTHTQAFWPYKAKTDTAQNGQQTPWRPGMDEASERNRKHGRSTILGKEMFLD